MTKWLIIVSVIFICTCSGIKENGPVIYGKVFYPNNGYIYLELFTPEGYEIIDSTRIDADHSFKLQARKNTPDIYRINFFHRQKNLITLADQDIWIEADGMVSVGRFFGKGSDEIEMISNAYDLVFNHNLKSGMLRDKLKKAQSKHDTIAVQMLKYDFEQQQTQNQRDLKELIRKHQRSLAALLVLSKNFAVEPNIEFYMECMPVFEMELKDHWFFDKLFHDYQDIKFVAIGSVAPDFELPDPNGKILKLSSFRGKYIYLDFWASWCQPCRIENPDLLKIYTKFKDSSFDILGISFDKNRKNWLKAIEDDGLEWNHVSDLKYFDSEMIELYNISNVPTTILLDPEGRIVAKNIHFNELDSILQEVL